MLQANEQKSLTTINQVIPLEAFCSSLQIVYEEKRVQKINVIKTILMSGYTTDKYTPASPRKLVSPF